MELNDDEQAKNIFRNYYGNYYQMKRDGEYEYYKKFNISHDVEYVWLREIQAENLDMLRHTSNNKVRAEVFSNYGNMVSQLHDTGGLQFMLEYTKDNAVFFDSNTLLRCANTILNTIGILQDASLESRVIREVLALLKNKLKQPTNISNDYKENGRLPDYLSTERVTANIREIIQYWENREPNS